MDKIALLIPCYNEEATISKVIEDYQRELPQARIYIYDNNSTDHTAKIASSCENVVVRREYQQGKGNVIRRMFREIDAECYVMVDGDDTYPAEYAKYLVEKVLCGQADMVVGDRLSSTYYSENKRPFHNIGNLLVCKSINRLFHSNIRDIMTGYRAFSYEFAKTFPILTGGFEIETEMSIHAIDKRMQVENVVIEYRDRPKGSVSKLNTYTDGVKVMQTILRLFRNYQPMAFYGVLSALLLFISVCFFIPVFLEFLKTGMVERFPTLIVCGFAVIAAMQSFFSGMILSNIVQMDRREFEYRLQRVYQDRIDKTDGNRKKESRTDRQEGNDNGGNSI